MGGGVRFFVCCKEMLIEENGDQKYIQETAEMIAAPLGSSCYSLSGWKQLGIQTKKQVGQVSVNLATQIYWQILAYHWVIKALRDEMEANLQSSVVGVGFGVSHKSNWKSNWVETRESRNIPKITSRKQEMGALVQLMNLVNFEKYPMIQPALSMLEIAW